MFLVWAYGLGMEPSHPSEQSEAEHRAKYRQVPGESVYVHNNRGTGYMDQYNFEKAVEEFKKALSIDPDFAIARVNLGIAYYNLREYENALKELKKGLRLKPGQPNALFVLGLVYKATNRIDDAISKFSQVLKLDPEDVATNYNLGLLYARKRDYPMAISFFRKALEVEPYNLSASYNLAIALVQAGKLKEGEKAMATYQRLKDKSYATKIGSLYLEEGQYSETVSRYKPTHQQRVGR